MSQTLSCITFAVGWRLKCSYQSVFSLTPNNIISDNSRAQQTPQMDSVSFNPPRTVLRGNCTRIFIAEYRCLFLYIFTMLFMYSLGRGFLIILHRNTIEMYINLPRKFPGKRRGSSTFIFLAPPPPKRSQVMLQGNFILSRPNMHFIDKTLALMEYKYGHKYVISTFNFDELRYFNIGVNGYSVTMLGLLFQLSLLCDGCPWLWWGQPIVRGMLT